MLSTGNIIVISIHALREESDGESFFTCKLINNFYPRSP